MTPFGYYWLASAIVSAIALMRVPSSASRFDNAGGSIVAGLAFGWLVWPFCIAAAIKVQMQLHRKDS